MNSKFNKVANEGKTLVVINLPRNEYQIEVDANIEWKKFKGVQSEIKVGRGGKETNVDLDFNIKYLVESIQDWNRYKDGKASFKNEQGEEIEGEKLVITYDTVESLGTTNILAAASYLNPTEEAEEEKKSLEN